MSSRRPRPALSRPAGLRPARLGLRDVARLTTIGLRTRPARAALASLGIAVGVGAMVGIVGISSSSRAEIDLRLAQLGPNLLQVSSAQNPGGPPQPLPVTARAAIARIGPVTATAQLAELPLAVYRNDHVPPGQTGSIAVDAVTSSALGTLHATIAFGSWFTPAAQRYPAVVLGATAARRLGVRRTGITLWLGGQWCAVVGVLNPITAVPALDSTALVGWQAAVDYFALDGHPTTVYARADQSLMDATASVIPASVSPAEPRLVAVSRPTDAIAARSAATSALSGLLVGLGAVALLIGGIGIANTMVVSVLERRPEIGLRRSLGATRGQIRTQFAAEAVLLSLLGGSVGAVGGTLVAEAYAYLRGWPTSVPAWVSAAGLAATTLIGALAGWYPAIRAGRMSPTLALTAI